MKFAHCRAEAALSDPTTGICCCARVDDVRFAPVGLRTRPCCHHPSDGRMTQNTTPLFGPTCLGAQT
jgi:hypothetical protein